MCIRDRAEPVPRSAQGSLDRGPCRDVTCAANELLFAQRTYGGRPVIVTLERAIADNVHDGDIVALEGFTHLIPFAAGHEIIRQKHRNLTLVRMTPDVIYDQMTSGVIRTRVR